jgi:hypothetical protein
MVDERLSLWQPRTVGYTAGMQLPRGTRLTLHLRCNKPLVRASITNPDSHETKSIEFAPQDSSYDFEHRVEALGEHLTLDVTLIDQDYVFSERPYRLHITGIEDGPPTINMRLSGIGTAVTPDVLVPASGKVTDDYGLGKAWVEVAVNDTDPREFDFRPAATGEADVSVDFRSERGKPDGVALQPKDKLHVTVKALDRYELGSGPHLAAGDHYQLDVVTPDQLLASLEARELGLRKQFEHIIEEMTEARDMLLRVRTDGPGSSTSEEVEAQPAGSQPSAKAIAERLERVWSLRLLRARQAVMQSQKSAQETLGVAAAFRDIREELINNRVDTEDRKVRLQDKIANPLQHIGTQEFPELDRRLEQLAAMLDRVEQRKAYEQEDAETVNAAQRAMEQTTQILNEMDAVLKQMVDLEEFNELLDIVRSLIEDQERLMNESKREQKKAVLDLLK